MTFDDRYGELVTLRDGTRAQLRMLRRDDKELVLRGFARLSPQARYNRFFAFKRTLHGAELRYLTEIDQVNHLAIVAVRGGSEGEEEGEELGIARAVRSASDAEVYDGAVTVVDEAQQRGLGRILMARILAAAAERGARRVRFSVLASNWPMRALLRQLAQGGAPAACEEVICVDIPLGEGALIARRVRGEAGHAT